MTKIIQKSIFTICLALLFVTNLFAYPAQVQDISGRNYYPAVKGVIDNAEKSIHVSMFVFALHPSQKDSAVYKLCNALIEAKNRGVDVRVILDQNVNFFDDEYKNDVEGKNLEAYQYLNKNGVEVYFDDQYTYTHSKAIVVDNEIVIIGSTNWSQSALTRNNEHSVLIRSPELAESILESFSEIKLADNRLKRPFDEEKALAVYKNFFSNKDLAGRMITKQDERAFGLYLLLLYNAREKNTMDFNFDKYAESLGIKDMTATAYRRQIIKTLRKLKKRYKLIDVEFYHGENADVKILDINDKNEDYKYPEEDYFLIPSEYFEYGWNRKLTFAGKFSYFINRYMVQESKSKYWSRALSVLSKQFHLQKDTIGRGMQELRNLNIIDINYAPTGEDHRHIAPSTYELLGLYSPEEQEKKLEQLGKKYGEEKLKNAVKFGVVVFRQNDIEAIEKIINLTEEYGEEQIKQAEKILSEKAVDNPKRTFRYAVGIIKK